MPAFTPHLLPLDQGELVSCYVTTTRPVDERRVGELYAEAYADEPFVELAERPPGVRDVRASNVCRIHVHADARTGKVFVFAAIDNLWKGASSQAVQNLNLMFGLDERAGLRVTERSSARAGPRSTTRVAEAPDRRLPQGFRAAGVAAGLKPSGAPDLGLLVCDAPEATSAARFTRSGVLAAPVLVCQRHARLDALRAWWPTPATRTARRAAAGWTTR